MNVQGLRGLLQLIDGGDRVARRRWIATIGLVVLADTALLYSLVLALQLQRTGQSYLRETIVFATAIVVWHLAIRRVWGHTATALNRSVRSLVDGIVERLTRLPLERFEGLGRGMLKMRLTDDVQRIVGASSAIVNVPKELARMSLAVVLMFVISPNTTVIAVAAMLLMAIAVTAQLRVMNRGLKQMAAHEVRLHDLLRGQIKGVNQLKLHAPRAQAVGGAFDEVSSGLRDVRRTTFSGFFKRYYIAKVFLYGFLGVNVFLIPLVFPVDSESIRDINLVLVWIVFSVFGIAFALPQLNLATDALQRLQALDAGLPIDELEPEAGPSGLPDRFVDFQSLSVHGLYFQYQNSGVRAGFGVQTDELIFQRGEVVFITGHNGSGKSTFLKVLTGLYPATHGEVRIDEQLIGPAELVEYRELFGTVFTHHHLFKRVFGMDTTAGEQAVALLEEMRIADKTGITDGRLDNRALSTGQKKRLAMVLTKLRDRPVMVFDEWAADQAPEFRALYYEKLLPELAAQGKLVIAVTHDDQYFQCADRRIHFHDGMIQFDERMPRGRP